MLRARAAALMMQALLSRAAFLARQGRYDSAELVLAGLPSDMPESIDLLARIRAQQGRMRDAAELWTKALRLDPSNGRFRDGLRKAEHNRWGRWTRPVVVMAIAALLVLAAGFGLQRLAARRSQVVIANPIRRPPVVEAEETRISFSVPGVVQNSSDATTILQFESGLFSRTLLLSPAGKEMLAAIGHQIEPHWRQVTLTVVGHTDDLPIVRSGRFHDNEALALARADAVIRYISTVSRIPASAWVIRRAPDVRCLYPCDSLAGRLKNRTVELRIAASQATP
jgi:outer membrane protein OmpA-like peptidoglycan-associated protein